MDLEGFMLGMGLIIGAAMGALLAVLLTFSHSPDKLRIICDHEGGVVQGEVCIKDGQVVEIE